MTFEAMLAIAAVASLAVVIALRVIPSESRRTARKVLRAAAVRTVERCVPFAIDFGELGKVHVEAERIDLDLAAKRAEAEAAFHGRRATPAASGRAHRPADP